MHRRTTLCSKYSMLKTVLQLKSKGDYKNPNKLLNFIRKKSEGYKAQNKTKTLFIE